MLGRLGLAQHGLLIIEVGLVRARICLALVYLAQKCPYERVSVVKFQYVIQVKECLVDVSAPSIILRENPL